MTEEIRIIEYMELGWRDRLDRAIKESEFKSMRAASLAAGCGENYLFDVLKVGKEPTLDKLLAVVDVLGVSLPFLLYGTEIGPDEEKLLRLFARLPEKQRQALFDLADRGEDH